MAFGKICVSILVSSHLSQVLPVEEVDLADEVVVQEVVLVVVEVLHGADEVRDA